MKIYDGFIFFNELDLLDIRLNTMYDVVDYFYLFLMHRKCIKSIFYVVEFAFDPSLQWRRAVMNQ